MSSWKKVTLEEISESINTGLDAIRRAPIVDFETDIKCLRIQDISQNKPIESWGFTEVKNTDYSKFRLMKDDIIMARTCSTGICFLAKQDLPAVFNNGLARIRLKKDIAYPTYVYYVFKSKSFISYIDGISGGTSVQLNMKIGDLSKYSFDLPPLNIQKEIANKLSDLDKKIQLNTQINQTLEQIAQTIFKSWFIDFDPVHAKANALASGQTAEQATQAAMAVISGKNTQELHRLQTANPEQYQQLWEIAEAFPSGVDEEGVPRGWESKKVGEVAKIVKGKSYKSSELAPSKTALVTLKSFNRGGGYRLDGLKEYTGNYKEEQEVFAGDLIIAYTDVTQAADVIGKPAMVMSDSCYEHLVISLDVGVVRPKNEKHKYFLYCLAMTDTFQAHTHSFCTGTTVLHLGKDAVPSFEFILPDNKFIELFDEFVLPIFVRINNIIEENKSLEKIRDELLPKLLSGEI
ncbi:restriction endonuclease subunit S [Glaesserella parasuis]|uniref:restriction endonuclease subunit S n=1 Tax=Glaesserella parasuis TaxID=738 RepID=UPI002436F9FC|nr:restriction endonuclease subunit S [Glaesserella parasuis]MDG6341264.1 restriction endonuclease subunit S [Glaesserella parasuis]MDG6367402.1 restriction endonuclease subunit S [Glaesserella parasuis]